MIKEYTLKSVHEMLSLQLSIPNYQRPYSWSINNVNQLFNDILHAYKTNLSEYRLGTVVIYDHNYKLNIVDGQQRLLTLRLLSNIIEMDSQADQLEIIAPKNEKSIVFQNYHELLRLWKSLSEINEQKGFKHYLYERCKLIYISIDKESEAFQFFDSQNSRGRALEVHDLLKAYHLRAMSNEEPSVKQSLINQCEAIPSAELVELFSRDLYRIKKWINNKHVSSFAIEGRNSFRGISTKNTYNFMQYHKSAHLFIENFNDNHYSDLLGIQKLTQFQLDQKIIAGRRFFEYVIYYHDLKKQIDKIVIDNLDVSIKPENGELIGTRYVRELYRSLLICYYDHFGIDNRNKFIEKLFMKYCYQLRVIHHSVYEETINNYALGKHTINNGHNIFEKIVNADEPREIEMIQLDSIDELINKRYTDEKYSGLLNDLGVILSNER
ncbi:DUF262 domain-containing protein [Macrococcus brunensis]|uniref:DUF262 domain-containing protein n=1 Tax=Macrococcus brunensis TaxID=198483 RepID=UPI001EF02D72|nr:DUF262 domain-containing protein [Macrococcus brunensis]ULG72397.1 DUF262 domain-containing protein [Macrococcus brunensis]